MSFTKTLIAASSITLFATTVAVADLAVRFDEGAPKDRFTFANTGSCALENAVMTLDLSGSKSGLIFDVTNSGAGVEVFQPLEITDGGSALKSTPKVKDGDNRIAFNIKQLAAGEKISFTIDVDDTMGGREITVSGSEIAGAKVIYAHGGLNASATFGSNARTTLPLKAC